MYVHIFMFTSHVYGYKYMQTVVCVHVNTHVETKIAVGIFLHCVFSEAGFLRRAQSSLIG